MTEFLVEAYVARTNVDREGLLIEGLGRAIGELTREGQRVRHLGSVFLPEDEVFLHLFRAASRDAVRDALTRTGLTYDRVVDAVGHGSAMADTGQERAEERQAMSLVRED